MRELRKGEFACALDAAADALTFGEFVDGVLEPLSSGMASSGALLYRYDASGMLDAFGGSLVGGISRYVAELFPVDPIQQALFRRGMIQEAVVPRLFPEIDWVAYRAGAAYNEVYRNYRIEDMLVVSLTELPYGSPGMCGILLTRAFGEPEFDTNACRQVSLLRPHLCRAVRRIERYADVERRRSALEAALESVAECPTVVIDVSGRVVHVSLEARRCLDGEALARLSSHALHVISGVVDEASALQLPGSRSLFATPLMATAPNGDAFVIMTLAETSHRPSAVQRICERCGLTAAEGEVLGLLAEGLSNSQIAQRLFVSIETVRTHVSRVLSKLGVSSRTQAALVVRAGGG